MATGDELKEQKFDAMLKPALYEQMLKEMEEAGMPVEKHEFSRSFDRKMKKLARTAGMPVEKRFRNVKVAVATGVVVVAALGIVTMNVDALRVPIWNLFMGEEYSVIDFGGKKEEIEVPVEYEEYVPGYVLPGYELVYAYGDEENCFLQYNNLDGQEYVVTIYINDIRNAFDTEKGEVTEIKIGDYDVIMVEKDERKWINFRVNTVGYIVEGSMEFSDIEKILASIG